MKFIDEVRILVASGKGGSGCVSFRRGAFMPRGGPDGGDGGHGGAIIITATTRRNTLVDYRWNSTWRAGNGQPGKGQNKKGSQGEDITLLVPIGTAVVDEETDETLADLDVDGATWRVDGGSGGLGNQNFATASRRTPEFATEGQPATERQIRLELRLLAQIGLLGFPNAGKSTLLSRLTAARPRIADYPFTTLVPQLGVVDCGDGNSFTIADLPGLIEGAADGVGRGIRFLKHRERCSAVLHLVAADAEEGVTRRWRTLRRELAAYDADLAARPEVLALSRCDLVDAATLIKARRSLARASGATVLTISSATGLGLDDLRRALVAHVFPAES